MVIGIDIDNICVNTAYCVLDYINERLKTDYQITDIKQYYIENMLPEKDQWIVEAAFADKTMWKKVKIIPDCVEGIRALYDIGQHDIYFVTSSSCENARKKIKHLTRNLKFLPEGYVEKHTIVMHKKQMLKLDILIDDCLDNFKDAEYTGICLKYPWNENGDLENVIYADDWTEIASIVLAEGIARIIRGSFLSDKDKRDKKK